MEARLASLRGPRNKAKRNKLRKAIKKRARGGEGGATRAVGGPGASVESPSRGSASGGAVGSSVLDREVPF